MCRAVLILVSLYTCSTDLRPRSPFVLGKYSNSFEDAGCFSLVSLGIFLIILSSSFKSFTGQCIIGMWYVRAGRAKVVVACTLCLSDSGDDKISHTLWRYSLPLSLSVCLSLSLSLPVSVCLSISVSVSLYLSVSLCLSLSLCLSVCLSLSLSLSLCVSLSFSLSVPLTVSLSVSIYLVPSYSSLPRILTLSNVNHNSE